MLEYFPERRKSSTDLLPLPKTAFFRRSPSPAKRSFSDLLNPFQKRSNDDSLFFIEKQEPFPKRPAKLYQTRNKMSITKNNCENISEILQSYSNTRTSNPIDSTYSFIDKITTEMPQEIFHRQSVDANNESKSRNEKSFIIWELITSEIVYLKQIYFIVKTPFPILNDIKQTFFPKLDVFLMFGNILDVFRSNVIFWTEYMENVFQILKNCEEVPNIRHMISGFNNFSKHFVPYKSYCMNISTYCEYITKFEMESENFRIFLEWCRNSDSSNRLGLDTFITMPFQRLTRYSLFLDRIMKECSDDEEIQELNQAICEVDKFVNNINKSIKVKELTSKLRNFQNILCGFPTIEEYLKASFPIPPYPVFNLTCPMQVKSEYESEVRCLLHQDTLRLKQIHRKTMSIKVLLFTDIVIFAKPIKKNQQCRLQLIDHPITLDQLVIYDSHTMIENDQSIYLAEINQFQCFSNIYKLSNDKSSGCKNSVSYLLKKLNFAKMHYETIMLQPNQSNVHINVVNSDGSNLNKEDDTCTNESSTGHHSGSSSVSDNESDNEYIELSNKSLSSSSWIDLENNLNSCIISDPFINCFDYLDNTDGGSQRNSYRYLLHNCTDKFGRRKHDSIQSFGGETTSTKNDLAINMFRRASLGNKHVIQCSLETE